MSEIGCSTAAILASPKRVSRGFTLSELLITLAILGVIATFTIPKLLGGSSSQKANAAAKEAIAALSGAYQVYKTQNTVSSNTGTANLTSYINYVKFVTDWSLTIDTPPGTGGVNCTAQYPCLVMHNGGIISYESGAKFGGTSTNRAIFFYFDPDGKYSGSTADSPGKSVEIWLYINGKVRTRANTDSGTTYNVGGSDWPAEPNASSDPSWFSWVN